MANRMTDEPRIAQKVEARRTLAAEGATLTPEQRDDLRVRMAGDDVLVVMLDRFAPLWLAGLLGAGIMAAVMASDSQILALSTMFTEDVFAHYGGKDRFGEAVQVQTGRLFVVLVTLLAYVIALVSYENIFSVAVSYGFSGFAATVPLLVGALFWRRSTKWGALAVTLWIVVTVAAMAVFQNVVPAPAPGQSVVALTLWGMDAIARTPAGTSVFGFLPVVPIVLGSALLMTVVSLLTRPPSDETLRRYFPDVRGAAGAGAG
jgi:solute:Na+ symporter, SSS family